MQPCYNNYGGIMIKQIIDKRNYIILSIIILLIIFILFGNNKIKEEIKSFYYFGETITLKIYTNKNSEKIFKDIDNIYEKYNNYYQNPNNKVEKDLIELLKYGKQLYQKTNGLIDITSNELVNKISNDEKYTFKTNINNLNFKDKATLNNINIDSIVGAFATKKVEEYLQKNNIDKYIINEDGNIITGKGINKEKYKVSIMYQNKLLAIAKLENESMATKGNTDTFKPYMVNPLTSTKHKENKMVVVIHKDINTANAIANALYLMSVKEGKEYISKYNAKAFWYKEDGAKQMTSGFKSYLENTKNL